MPSNQEQNERQHVCLLPSTVLSSAKAFYAFDDVVIIQKQFLPTYVYYGKTVFFLISLGRTLLFIDLRSSSVLQSVCPSLKIWHDYTSTLEFRLSSIQFENLITSSKYH